MASLLTKQSIMLLKECIRRYSPSHDYNILLQCMGSIFNHLSDDWQVGMDSNSIVRPLEGWHDKESASSKSNWDAYRTHPSGWCRTTHFQRELIDNSKGTRQWLRGQARPFSSKTEVFICWRAAVSKQCRPKNVEEAGHAPSRCYHVTWHK